MPELLAAPTLPGSTRDRCRQVPSHNALMPYAAESRDSISLQEKLQYLTAYEGTYLHSRQNRVHQILWRGEIR